jgi:hypothetical protein
MVLLMESQYNFVHSSDHHSRYHHYQHYNYCHHHHHHYTQIHVKLDFIFQIMKLGLSSFGKAIFLIYSTTVHFCHGAYRQMSLSILLPVTKQYGR